jgi:hypothetical protein
MFCNVSDLCNGVSEGHLCLAEIVVLQQFKRSKHEQTKSEIDFKINLKQNGNTEGHRLLIITIVTIAIIKIVVMLKIATVDIKVDVSINFT